MENIEKQIKPIANQVLVLFEKDFEEMKASAEICPVNVIHIKKKETNEKII